MKRTLLITMLLYSAPSFSLANPASVYCAKVGGKTIIETLPSRGQIGICYFGKNQECEEWALFRKNCPIGGINTQNLSKEARYCIILGGILDHHRCIFPK